MTRRAIFGRRLVEEYGLGRDYLGQLVALRATHVLVCSSQRKLGPLLMIE